MKPDLERKFQVLEHQLHCATSKDTRRGRSFWQDAFLGGQSLRLKWEMRNENSRLKGIG
jgi:hypothetical protein